MTVETLSFALIDLFGYEPIDFEGMNITELKHFVRTDLTDEARDDLAEHIGMVI